VGGELEKSENRTVAQAILASKAYAIVRGSTYFMLVVAAFVCCMGSITSDLGVLLGWLLALGWYWVAVFVHEAGHAVAAAACGWRILVFVAGPFGYHIHNREFAVIPRSKRSEFAGFVLPTPRSAAVWTRSRAAIISAAGPLASVILALVSGAVAITSRNADLGGGFDLSLTAAGLSLMSTATALITLTPSRAGKRASDIQQVTQSLRTDDAKWLKTRAIARLYGLVKHQIRLRDLPTWMLEESRIRTCDDNVLMRGHEALEIAIEMDKQVVDAKLVREMLCDFRERHGDDAWTGSSAAYLAAVWERDRRAARASLWQGDIEEELRPFAFAAEAAIAALEGDGSAATLLLKHMRKAIRQKSAFSDCSFRDIEQQVLGLLPT